VRGDRRQAPPRLSAVSGWADRTADWLRRRWPDADVDLGAYAPYTPRT
jgi:hypothetical protein